MVKVRQNRDKARPPGVGQATRDANTKRRHSITTHAARPPPPRAPKKRGWQQKDAPKGKGKKGNTTPAMKPMMKNFISLAASSQSPLPPQPNEVNAQATLSQVGMTPRDPMTVDGCSDGWETDPWVDEHGGNEDDRGSARL